MFDYSNIKVTKIEVGTREWAIAVTDLTMTFLVLGGFFFFFGFGEIQTLGGH